MKLDHTIVPVRDTARAVKFYTDILGLKDAGTLGPFAVVQVNDGLSLDFQATAENEIPVQHYAFSVVRDEFDAIFARLKNAGYSYGDDPHDPGNMKGPGRSPGVGGIAESVYFRDPDGHILEILTY